MRKGLAAGILLLGLPACGLDRLALVVGDNEGLADEKPLSYATRDAEQVYAALVQLGGVDKGAGYLLLEADAAKVKLALGDMRARVQSLKARGRKVQVLIYYSGHGSDQALHVQGESLPLAEVRDYFSGLAADFKLLIADACFSGSLIQAKGGGLADPIPIHYQDELSVNGSAILTSSSAGEISRESRELRGSLFTHYFVTGLRGAADFDRDGKVTLWEAYAYTQAGLRLRLAREKALSQTPGFDVDAHGSDGVVLTRLDLGQAFLSLQGLPADEYRVLEAAGGTQVAELHLSDPEGVRLALPRAAYLVCRGRGKQSASGFADLRKGKAVALGPKDFAPAGEGRLEAKGRFEAASEAPADRSLLQVAARPRFYPAFPGRTAPALGLEAALETRAGGWALSAAGLFLPSAAEAAAGNRMVQGGVGVSIEIRYYWSYSWLGAASVGPRGEWWSLSQSVNGRDLPRADVLGGFAALGFERALGAGFGLSVAAEAGFFLSREAGTGLRGDPAFPLSLSLRYGP
ncbi:MAG TPA: caspase family protein [Fibrobacteria bacterium]|nr:caspase family protein [Fibrobacteria bacterium]